MFFFLTVKSCTPTNIKVEENTLLVCTISILDHINNIDF